MSLSDIDTTRALRTDDELLALVEAIHSSPPSAQETNWLEWKSTLNVSVVEGRFPVAKAILGFANRSVTEAHRACEGVAYMVVGVEPDNASGVAAIDHASLSQGLKTYVDSARWSLRYVEFAGVNVLVVMIEAPRAGDPIHALQKGYDKHYRGAVFHRGAAQTEPAGPKELAMLQERLLEGQREPDLDLEFDAQAEPLTRLRANPEEIEDWLHRREAYVRANSGQPPPPAPPPTSSKTSSPFPLGGAAGFASSLSLNSVGAAGFLRNTYKPEDAEEFERRVEDYLAQFRTGVVEHMVRQVVKSDYNKITFAVGNETDDSVRGIKLTVTIPQSGVEVHTSPPRAEPLPVQMPKWPNPADDWVMANVPAPVLVDPDEFNFAPGPSVLDKDNSFEVIWNIGDLRPGEWSGSCTLTIVVGPNAPDELGIELVARSLSHRRIATSKLTVTVRSEPLTIDDFYDAAPDK
ncbi:AlbA family DNA-binding domain-containing protein [Mycobacterium simiae]|uniref:Uncharacterized protein n=1 Tax=Mycobacterium simiae TaxID=1784 RepID=A0A1X0XI93_MYCSI|nr:hypothetical protein [Mycobacterium simiae]ORJ52612.1 hypothetical protein B5M45_30975 [Mycobacterium simiae]